MIESILAIRSFLEAPIVIGTLQFPFNWFVLIVSAIVVAAILVVYRVALMLLRKLLDAIVSKETTKKSVYRWSRIVLRVLFVVGVFGIVGLLFGARMFEYLGRFFAILGEPLLSSGSTSISFLTLLLTIPVFYVASWAGRMSRGILDQALLSRMGLDESKKFSIASLVRYGVMVVVVLVGLSVIGIDLSALTVLFGVLGIGVGFGLQSVVANFFSGLIIILTRPIKEGDRILVDGMDATVVHIRILSTIINTVTEETIIIPNTLLVNNSVHNYSYDSRSIIVLNTVEVSYRSDLDRVIEVMESVARDNPYLQSGGPSGVRVAGFGSSGIEMRVFAEIRNVDEKSAAQSWTNLEIWRRFKANGIEIPFPQMDVHLIDQKESLRLSIPGRVGTRGDGESGAEEPGLRK